MRQSKEIKELFYKKIKEKVELEKEVIKGRIEQELPSWASWAVKPLVGLFHDWQNAKNTSKGEDGEFSAFFKLWLLLPKEWIILNDVVLEPEQDEFIQLDHLLIGPPGVFIIETKAWDGAFTGYKDNWKRKEGNGWTRCSSPTKQNKRHADLFIKWLMSGEAGDLPPEPTSWVFPLVVFTNAKWLKVTDCSMPVFDGGLELSIYIRRKTKEQRLSVTQIDAIAKAVVNAKSYVSGKITSDLNKPVEKDLIGNDTNYTKSKQFINKTEANRAMLESNVINSTVTKGKEHDREIHDSNSPKIEQRQTKDGRRYVRIYGTEEEAKEVRLKFEKNGEKAGPLKSDRYNRGAWYFYID
jgi:hypothetical protein